MAISRRHSLRARAERRFRQAASSAGGTALLRRLVSAVHVAGDWLNEHERVVAFGLPPLLFAYCITLRSELFCCANVGEATSALQTMTSVAVGVAALVVPLLVLVVESAGRRGLDAPTDMLWRLTGLRGVIAFVYWTLAIELVGYVLVHRLDAWRSGVATGGLLVLLVTLVRLAVTTNGVISQSQPGIIKERWLAIVGEQAKALAKEDVIRRLGTSILSEELKAKKIDTEQTYGSSLVLGEEQMTVHTIPPETPFQYVDDIDLAVVVDCANRLMPGDDHAFRRVTFGITLGEAAAISDGITMVHSEDATVAAERMKTEFRSALRLTPSRSEPLRENVEFLAQAALAALARNDSAHAATLINDLSAILVECAVAFRKLPADMQNLPRRRSDRLQLCEWTAGVLDGLTRGAGVGPLPSAAVDDALLALWRRGWALAVGARDPLGGTYLAQMTPGLERLIKGLTPTDRQQRFRDWVAGGPWGALRWIDVSEDDKGTPKTAIARLEEFGALAVTAMVGHLRQTIRHADPDAFKQVLDSNQEGELALRGELDMRLRLRAEPRVGGEDTNEGMAAVSANLYDRFRIGVGKAASWAFKLSLSGHVPPAFTRRILTVSQGALTADVAHLVRTLRSEMGELVLTGDRDTDWMWEMPTGAYAIPATLGQPLWAFVLAYIRTPPDSPILLPELKTPVTESDPERLLVEILRQAEERADVVVACLNEDLTTAAVHERVARLRQETKNWKQQLQTMRLTQIAAQPLDLELIGEHTTLTQQAFDRHRIIGGLLKAAGRETSRFASVVAPYTNDHVHHREDFIVNAEGAVRYATGVGEIMARAENSVIAVAALQAKGEDVQRVDWHAFDGEVGAAIAALRASGYNPSVIFIGDQSARLLLKMQPRTPNDPVDPYVLGRKDDVLVLVAAHLPNGRAVVSDVVRAGRAILDLEAEGGHPVRSTIADLSGKQIEELLLSHPELRRDDDGTELTEAQAKLRLRTKVRWWVRLHLDFEVDDANAIRVVQIEPEPGDDEVIDYVTSESR